MNTSAGPTTAAAPDWENTAVQDDDAARKTSELSSRPSDSPATAPGYRIVQKLGEGKFGSVWLAEEQNTGKQVAIKFYTTRRGVDWALLSREVEKLAVLYTSRNIVGLLGVGWDHDPPYYVMEYLENGSLAGALERGPLSVPDAVRVTTRVAQALVHAHGSGILHCDLKPANVLLDQDFEPRLCDFGQSRLVDEHAHALGTLFYMAPEQADLRATPDARWDVYALGALLYHMLTGSPPCRTPDVERRLHELRGLEERLNLYRQVVRQGPRPTEHRRVASVDAALSEIIDRCLAVDPLKRFPNIQVVLDRLAARERHRARRPLILLGLVLPLLLLAAVAPFAFNAMQFASTTSERSVIRRAIESDLLSAKLLARSIERELQDRLDELLFLSDDSELADLVQEYATRPQAERLPLWEWLNDKKQSIDQRRREQQREPDASWFLTDARGVQRWRQPISEGTIDQNYAHRDYFHGRDRDFAPGQAPPDIQPLTRKHVSVAYVSTSTGRFVVALSCPIWDRERKEVLGVLARTAELGQLLIDYEQYLNEPAGDGQVDDVNRVIALVDSRSWRLLSHKWLAEQKKESVPSLQVRLADRTRERLERLLSLEQGLGAQEGLDYDEHYEDPAGRYDPTRFGGTWLAAFCPLGPDGWIAVVQERRDRALRPIRDLRGSMASYGMGGLLISTLLIGGCWWFITRVLNDHQSRTRRSGRRGTKFGSSTAGNSTGSLTATWRSGDGA